MSTPLLLLFHQLKPPVDEFAMSSASNSGGSSADNNDLWRVPSSAGGPGYVPLRRGAGSGDADGRWLDAQVVRKGDCIAYRGEACRQFLGGGKHVKVLVDREHIYDAGE